MMTYLPQEDAQAAAGLAKKKKYVIPADISFPDRGAWTPQTLDPAAGARLAYVSCSANHGCCHAAFYGIIGQMAEKYGAPYSEFPFRVMVGGRGGVGGFGSICGALLGAALALGMFYENKDLNEMVREIFHWHNNAELPIYRPGDEVKIASDIPTSVSGSVLCDVSNAKWAYASGFRIKSKERSERCARLTADVTKKAIEVLNAKIAGTFVSTVKATSAPTCDETGSIEIEGTAGPVILVRQPEFKVRNAG